MAIDKNTIDMEISSLGRKVYLCTDNIESLLIAKECSSKIANGISTLSNGQYEKVKSNCIEAIGEEEAILEALKFKNESIYRVNDGITKELQYAINTIQNKVDEYNLKIEYLKSQLVEAEDGIK